MNTLPSEFEKPEGLCALGEKAYEEIIALLVEFDLAHSGGHTKVFYSPPEWAARDEQYANRAVLVIMHDGGDHGDAFSFDREQYKIVDEMIERLKPHGIFPEQSTRWLTGIYKI